jgi:hypothetical protein
VMLLKMEDQTMLSGTTMAALEANCERHLLCKYKTGVLDETVVSTFRQYMATYYTVTTDVLADIS